MLHCGIPAPPPPGLWQRWVINRISDRERFLSAFFSGSGPPSRPPFGPALRGPRFHPHALAISSLRASVGDIGSSPGRIDCQAFCRSRPRKDRMRSALIGVATIAAALAAGAQSGSAQESFFNNRYCVSGGENDVLDCSYRTWQQCIASARGLTNVCEKNPWWHGPRKQPTTQGKSRRRNR
jgi:hypothetical protein